jgi:hypothetical protein
MKRILLATLTACTILSASLAGAPQEVLSQTPDKEIKGYQASSLLNLFIAEHSYDKLQWQTQARLLPTIAEPQINLQPGELLGVSEYAGYYAYTPASWGGLTEDQRADTLQDPRLLPWLAWFNGKLKPVAGIGLTEKEKASRTRALVNATQLTDADPDKRVIVPGDFGRYSYQVSPEEVTQANALYIKLVGGTALPVVEPISVVEPLSVTQ